jgi:deoxyribodipyrimidine photolyase-related protein
MPKQKTLRLILGDRLDELHSWFKTPDIDVTYVMMEIRQETDYVKHHIQCDIARLMATVPPME